MQVQNAHNGGRYRIPDEIRLNWGFLLAATIGVATSSTIFLVFSIGVFVKPLSMAFGWSRQEIFGALTAATLGTLPASIVAGWLADRIHNWKLIAASQLALGVGCFALAASTSHVWLFYTLYGLTAVASAGALAITFSRMLSFRFVRFRGVAMGVALSGSGLCGLLLPSYAAYFVKQFGWREGYLALGLLPICIAVPATLLGVRGHPSELPRATGPARNADLAGTAFAEALRDRRFWQMLLAFFLMNGAAVGIITNLVPHLADEGYSLQSSAHIASLFGAFSIIGRVGIGALMDRFWVPMIAFAVLSAAAVATATLVVTDLRYEAVLLLTAVIGIATGAEVDFLSYLVPKYFGLKALGTIYGCIFAIFNLSAGISPVVFGHIYDARRSYDLAFLIGGSAWFIGGVLLLLIGPYPKWAAGNVK
jgi:OFA family oxalate/formate antiporter-like MFS transporter